MIAAALCFAPTASLAKDKKMEGPEVVEIADISVGLSGLVCDFCSIALNKTFKKRDEVRGTYVDLDTKTLSVALNTGADLTNDEIITLVKKAGYSTTKIKRKDGREFIPASDT
jgi:cation transport ATPase